MYIHMHRMYHTVQHTHSIQKQSTAQLKELCKQRSFSWCHIFLVIASNCVSIFRTQISPFYSYTFPSRQQRTHITICIMNGAQYAFTVPTSPHLCKFLSEIQFSTFFLLFSARAVPHLPLVAPIPAWKLCGDKNALAHKGCKGDSIHNPETRPIP